MINPFLNSRISANHGKLDRYLANHGKLDRNLANHGKLDRDLANGEIIIKRIASLY